MGERKPRRSPKAEAFVRAVDRTFEMPVPPSSPVRDDSPSPPRLRSGVELSVFLFGPPVVGRTLPRGRCTLLLSLEEARYIRDQLDVLLDDGEA